MIVLWTDSLFWILILAGFFMLLIPKPRHIVNAWAQLAHSKMAMVTLVILFFYLVITALDCIHFKLKGQGEILSVLDLLMSPLNQSLESSYSAPFSTESLNYSKPDSGVFYMNAIHALLMSTLGTIVIWVFTRRALQVKTILITFFIASFALFYLYLLSRHFHVMGTDKVGQDVFYQTLKSIRTGVLIGTLTTLVMFPFAILFGTLAGYFRGWVDDIVQYVYTTLSSIPDVLLIVAFMLMLEMIMARFPDNFTTLIMRADFRLLALCLIFGLTSWSGLCRLLRAETLKLREMDYVRAGRVLGSSNAMILKRHVIPNLMHIVFISIAMDFSGLVLAEAVLSYVGVGVDSATFSWGNMINAARLELAREPIVWWSLSAAFIFMFILVLCANLFADILQKSFDPRTGSERNV
jgi:peptide/nickel transport system permease protein